MKAWKHHISEHFEPIGFIPCHPNGGGKGGTIFLNYQTMIEYLKNTEMDWHVAELNVTESQITRHPNNKYLATLNESVGSDFGFYPLNLQKSGNNV
jgi:hypothetical protein